MSSWEIYDRLIEGIDLNLCVDQICQGVHWTIVRANGNTGIAMTIRQKGPRMIKDRMSMFRSSLKELARLSKSWDYYEASIGTAAINCYYNRPSDIKKERNQEKSAAKNDAFEFYFEQIKNKKVAVIGHFPAIEKRLGKQCDLTILEREPQIGDYPDPYGEFILKEQDYIFMTGTTFTNKTLPRLLELRGKKSKVFMVGPSVSYSKVFFEQGIDVLSGFCVVQQDLLQRVIQIGGQMEIFDYGMMFNIEKRDHTL